MKTIADAILEAAPDFFSQDDAETAADAVVAHVATRLGADLETLRGLAAHVADRWATGGETTLRIEATDILALLVTGVSS